MKYAFLILAHTDPRQLHRLVHALDDPRFDVFVHVDAKSDIAAFEFEKYSLRHSRLTVLEERRRLYWGDISIVHAMIALYRKAYESGEYARFITLSGLDYPIRSNEEIYGALLNLNVEYIRAIPLPRWQLYRLRYVCVWKFGSLMTRCSMGLSRRGFLRHPDKLKLRGEYIPVYFGSQWHALSRPCVAYLLETLDQDRGIIRFFRFAYAPDELLIPTIVYQSPFRAEVLQDRYPEESDIEALFQELPAIHYLRRENRNLVAFTETEYADLRSSGKLFFRKARTGVSDRLLDMIDEARKDEVEI